MGDADTSRTENQVQAIEQVTGVLDALDEDLNQLHETVNDLEERTLRAMSLQIEGYANFRLFFLAMNFIILPIIAAMAVCYGLQETDIDQETQDNLNGAMMALLYLSASLGVPLYFGALWAICMFSGPSEMFQDEFFRAFFQGEDDMDDMLPALDARRRYDGDNEMEEHDQEPVDEVRLFASQFMALLAEESDERLEIIPEEKSDEELEPVAEKKSTVVFASEKDDPDNNEVDGDVENNSEEGLEANTQRLEFNLYKEIAKLFEPKEDVHVKSQAEPTGLK